MAVKAVEKKVPDELSAKVRHLAIETARDETRLILDHEIAAQIRAVMADRDLTASVINQMFRPSGASRSKATEHVDKIICDLLQDEVSGVPDAIRKHVKQNLHDLVEKSIREVVLSMVASAIQDVSIIRSAITNIRK